MATPQKDNGYTPIANEILEALSRTNMSNHEWRIIFIVLRYSYGYRRKDAELSLSFLAKATKIDRRNIPKAIKKLSQRDIIIKEPPSAVNESNTIRFNKDYDMWKHDITPPDGDIRLKDIQPDVMGDVRSDVGGDIQVNVGGDIRGDTKGTFDRMSKKENKENTQRKKPKEKTPKPPGQAGKSEKPLTPAQILVHEFFKLKGWEYTPDKRPVFVRHLRPATEVLSMCRIDEAIEKLRAIAAWAEAKNLDWSIETLIKRWPEVGRLTGQAREARREAEQTRIVKSLYGIT